MSEESNKVEKAEHEVKLAELSEQALDEVAGGAFTNIIVVWPVATARAVR